MTPGSWAVKGDPMRQDLPTWVVSVDEDGHSAVVAQVLGGSRHRPGNARLLSAAPDLLKALEAVLHSKDRRALDQAAAAIEKARVP